MFFLLIHQIVMIKADHIPEIPKFAFIVKISPAACVKLLNVFSQITANPVRFEKTFYS